MAHYPAARFLFALRILASLMLLIGCQPVQPTGVPSPAATAVDTTPTVQPAQPAPAPSVEMIVAGLEGLPIDRFFEDSYRQLLLRDPDSLFVNGLAGQWEIPADQFTDRSDAYTRETGQMEVAILELLRSYDRAKMTDDQQLSYDIYERYLADQVRGHRFMVYDYPVNPLTVWGAHNWLVDFMVNTLPLEDRQDAEAYISRLSQIDTWTDQLLEGMALREQAGVIPPRFLIEGAISQVEGHLQMQSPGTFDVDAITLFASFSTRLQDSEALSEQERQALRQAARAEVEGTFIPAFVELREYLLHLAEIATDDLGAWKFPDGEAYYAYLLHQQTSTDMTPGEVHELGQSEVERILAEIRLVAIELGYPADTSLAELNPQVESLSGDALLAEFQRLIADMELKAGDSFNLYPGAELVILPEPYGSLSYYVPPPLYGAGAGEFFVSMKQPLTRDILPSLIYHETIPGHHLQGALTRELDLPTFRRNIEFNAYIEGWATYAERLAWEMGIYENDALGNLGRLYFELSRATRLVVDTGIHARGWTAEQALDYLEEIYGVRSNLSSLTRYIVLPAQACGYTVGMLKILEIRQRAMEQLGDRFDIKAFHDVVLGNGPMPFELLESTVNAWINGQLRP